MGPVGEKGDNGTIGEPGEQVRITSAPIAMVCLMYDDREIWV